MKTEHDEEAEAFLESRGSEDLPTIANRKNNMWKQSWTYIRVLVELAMAVTIVYLLFFRAPPSRNIRKSPVPECTSRHQLHNSSSHTKKGPD
jgi:hypothetical protein